ncbi:uncharacterized protein LOC108959487 [Eucalyptus grandis]|uniref:uncharacterized protein LOC108959487 n=1 Tax=Eucalyptus grandis TaxID=71139 RepID=UPI0008A0DC20|nr:uncharacterized protein LOC108959487 [Eucalyptus grandis]
MVGHLVMTAVMDFFTSGKLLREINNTILVRVPKVLNATSVEDYRPIACCNTIYKCITKVLANQELFSNFNLEPYLPKCAKNVDFKKAYNTVDWDFLESVLLAFGFPQSVTRLIMTCVRTPKFSIALNGELHGFFASGQGLR